MRPAWCLVLLFCAACLDNAGPEDRPAQVVEPVGDVVLAGTAGHPVGEISVKVTDLRGNRIAGVEVEWTTYDGGELVPLDDGRTASTGIARALWTLGATAGTQTARARVIGVEEPAVYTAEAGGFVAELLGSGTGEHICAVDPAGSTWCWGGAPFAATPTRIATNARFVQLVTGGGFACGLTDGGEVLCWGDNDNGQLGDGTTVGRADPAPIALPGTRFTGLSAFNDGLCGVTTSGEGYCWGRNVQRRFASGSAGAVVTAPSLVSGGIEWTTIGLADDRACGIDRAQAVWCWGGSPAFLGLTPPPGSSFVPDPVRIASAVPLAELALTIWDQCGLAYGAPHSLYCWKGGGGPRLVAPPPAFREIRGISETTAGVTSDGRVYYWGSDPHVFDGFVGAPVLIETPLRFRAIGLHGWGICAIEDGSGVLYCSRSEGFGRISFAAVRAPE